jgi:AraC family transcriptional regulator, exoenzyme S synthesis regulatory protein ExsA
MITDHTLVYVYSGELLVEENDRKTKIHSGECVFLRRDNRVNMTKKPKGEEHFKAVFMIFKRTFLREFFQILNKKQLPFEIERHRPSVIKLSGTPDISSLFRSMVPYFDSSVKPTEQLMKLKLQEGVYSLLNIDKRFYSSLFDFTEPWKIDILDFMEKNYMYDFTVEDIANFTGRSLATFKRDFKKISSLPPQKWLIEKRLKAAYDKIRNEKMKVTDVYLEVGFKNLSHFSSAFKKQFGFAPTK